LTLVGLLAAAGLACAQDVPKTPPVTAPDRGPSETAASSDATKALLTRLAAIDVSDAAFRKLDTDHDGRISALEANANPKVAARFLEADKNHDGYLSLEEFRSLGKPSPPVTDPPAP
jgi:hypothetical protein